jgi:retron-type reverse transcriptase
MASDLTGWGTMTLLPYIVQPQKAGYVLEADISGCFDSTNHQVLLNKLALRSSVGGRQPVETGEE